MDDLRQKLVVSPAHVAELNAMLLDPKCEVVNDRLIVIEFENGIAMHLEDNSDQYESMVITFEGNPSPWII